MDATDDADTIAGSEAVEAIRSLQQSAVELRSLAVKLGELQRALLAKRERLLRALPANDA